MTEFFADYQAWLETWRWPLAVLAGLLLLDQLRRLRAGDRLLALGLFAHFFLVIVAFWILKPAKKALFLAYYARHDFALWGHSLEPAQVEMLAKQVNAVVALAAALIGGLLARRMRREAYVLTFTLLLAAGLLALQQSLTAPTPASVWLFYLYGDLFVTVMVASLFSLLADSFAPHGAHSGYTFVGLGGVLGGFAGSGMASLSPSLSDPSAAALAAFSITLGVAASGLAVGFVLRRRPILDFAPTATAGPGGAPTSALTAIRRSPYLRLILAVVVLYELVSVSMDYQFTATVTRLLEPSHYRGHFAAVFAFTNFVSLAIQLFVTGWLLRRWGAGPALMLMPAVAIAGSLAFFASPVLLWASLLNTADNALAYSVQQTAKEFLYLPTSRQEKYEAKALIDVFGLRLAKGLAVVLGGAISLLFAGDAVRWLSIVAVGLLVLWSAAAWRLWNLHREILLRQPEADSTWTARANP